MTAEERPADGSASSSGEVTRLLQELRDGRQDSLERLVPLIYDDLRRLAGAFLRLVRQRNTHWQNRAHFFAIAAQAMRRILVEHARARRTAKRGGDWERT